jgi:hypothetical protein
MALVTTEVDGVEHRSEPRNEARMLVEIETDVVGGFSVCGTYVHLDYPRKGEPKPAPLKQKIVIFEHEWRLVQSLVRTDAHVRSLEMAKDMAKNDLANELAKATTPAAQDAVRRDFRDTTYEHLHKLPGCRQGIPPLLSAKVVRKDVPPPPTAQNVAANQMGELAGALRALLAERDGSKKSKD